MEGELISNLMGMFRPRPRSSALGRLARREGEMGGASKVSGWEAPGVGNENEFDDAENTVDSQVGGVRLSAMMNIVSFRQYLCKGMWNLKGEICSSSDQGMKLRTMRVAAVPLVEWGCWD